MKNLARCPPVGGRPRSDATCEAGILLRRAGSPVPRNGFSEWLRIEDGKVRNIWTTMYYAQPERTVPDWPPYEKRSDRLFQHGFGRWVG